MNIFNALGFQPHGISTIRPLPEGGWFVKNNTIDGPHFVAYSSKEPDYYWGYCPVEESVKVLYYRSNNHTPHYIHPELQVSWRENSSGDDNQKQTGDEIYSSPSKFQDCVPPEGFFAGIFSPRDRKPIVFGHHLLPKNEEAFRAALGVPEDRYTLVISKVGGYFEKFDLPYQKTACCMPSCDGLTVLVAQEDRFTIFDNPL